MDWGFKYSSLRFVFKGLMGVGGGAVERGTALQAGKIACSIPNGVDSESNRNEDEAEGV